MTSRPPTTSPVDRRLDLLDSALITLFLLGLYLGVALTIWLIPGQASGSYVGPKTWSVLLIAAAASILRVGARQHRPAAMRSQASGLRPQLRFINPRPGYLQS